MQAVTHLQLQQESRNSCQLVLHLKYSVVPKAKLYNHKVWHL